MMTKIQSLFYRLKGKEFINASFFSAIASVVKILTTLIIGKFIALKLGTEGLALFGQLYSFVLIILVFGGGAMSQGIVKYIAEYLTTKDQRQLKSMISTSFQLSVISSGIIGLLLIILPKTISFWIFDSPDYYYIFYVFGISLILYVLNNFFIAIVNGHIQYKKTNQLNIISNLLTLAISLLLIYFYGISGALLSVVIAPVFSFFVVIFILRNEPWVSKSFFWQKIEPKQVKLLTHFIILGIVSSALFPWSSILIRNIIIDKVSLSAAGIYELVTRISGASLMFFTLTVTTYFIPKISGLKNIKEVTSEIKSVYKIMVPFVVVILIGIFVFKIFLIKLLADDRFLDAQYLFKYQLVGDFFKVCAQIFSFALVARAKVWWVIIIDVSSIVIQIVLTYILVGMYGIEGAAMAYMFMFILYFTIFAILFLRKKIF
ncbi:MAG: O-antigen translocase [Bacteroidetes bacterium]|nr:O-antigen translocase [Bacteroidota bacterium]